MSFFYRLLLTTARANRSPKKAARRQEVASRLRRCWAGLESLEPRALLYSPLGSESLVNVTTADTQQVSSWAANVGGASRSMAGSANGSYVVTWESGTTDGTGFGLASGNVYARVFGADGSPLTGEIQVNAITTVQNAPSPKSAPPGFDPTVAVDQAGNFVVAFKAQGTADSAGIFARRFQANGTPLGNEFLVNTTTKNTQEDPAIAMAPGGSFVVTWSHDNIIKAPSFGNDGLQQDIYAQRFAANGAKLGSQFLVHAKSSLPEYQSTVAVDANGNFAIGWGHDANFVLGSFGGYQLFVQRYDSSGAKLGSPIELPRDGATAARHDISLAYDGAGRLVATWREHRDNQYSILAQVYDANGLSVGNRIQVSDAASVARVSGSQTVAADQAGNFLVVWQARDSVNLDSNIYGRRILASGAPDADGIFLVNTTVALDQRHPSVAVTPDGSQAVVVWDGYGALDDSGVFMQRFDLSAPPPAELSGQPATTTDAALILMLTEDLAPTNRRK